MIRVLTELGYELQQNYRGFTWKSARTRLAFIAALAATLAIWLAFLLNFSDPYWAGISALVVVQANQNATLLRGILRFVATVAGAWLGIVIASLFAPTPLPFLLSVFLITTLGMARANESENPYLWILGTGTFLMVAMAVIVAPDAIIETAFFRSAEVIIGIFSAWLVSSAIPTKPKKVLLTHLQSLIKDLQKLIADNFQDYLQGSHAWQARYAAFKNYRNAVNQNFYSRRFLWLETLTWQKMPIAWLDWYETLDILGILFIHCVEVYPQLTSPTATVKTLLRENAAAVKNYFDILAAFVVQPEKISALTQAAQAWQMSLHALQAEVAQDLALTAWLETQKNMLAVLITLTTPKPALPLHNNALQFKNIYHWWQTILQPDNLSLQFGIKSALGVLTVPLFWIAFNLPGLDQIAISIIAIVQLDTATTGQKGWQRIEGCLIGAVTALAVIALNITNIVSLLLLILIVLFIFAYLHHGNSKINYFGTQAAVAFILGVVNGLGPVTVLSPSLERLSGIVMGVIVIAMLNRLLWPSTGQKLLQHYLRQARIILQNLCSALQIEENKKKSWSFYQDLHMLYAFRRAIKSIDADYEQPAINQYAQQMQQILRAVFYDLAVLVVTEQFNPLLQQNKNYALKQQVLSISYFFVHTMVAHLSAAELEQQWQQLTHPPVITEPALYLQDLWQQAKAWYQLHKERV